MQTIKDLYEIAVKELKPIYGKEHIYLIYILLENISGMSPVEIFLDLERKISDKERQRFLQAIELLKKHYPVQYILNKAQCFGLDFYVDESVLIPRPETEELIELTLKTAQITPQTRIIDIGTGSGCIAIVLKKYTNAKIMAADISRKALEIGKKNAETLEADVEFLKMDIFNPFVFTEKFDIIISNPPYVRESEKSAGTKNILYEPAQALFVPDKDPLKFYKAIRNFAEKNLAKNGIIYLEINSFLWQETENLFKNQGYKTKIFKDLSGKNRFLAALKNSEKQ